MARHARSFAPAARLLRRGDRVRLARLYALCRTVDDIADDVGGPTACARLRSLQTELTRPQPQDPLAIEAHDLLGQGSHGSRAFRELVAAAAADTGATRIADDRALDAYCMGVAGTVGVMVCALFDIDARWHPAATDLGKAMQLTNICRDVAEDARAGRRYLPYTHCPYPPRAIAAGRPDAIHAAGSTMGLLLETADDLYLSGRRGLVALPVRLRLAVAAAAAMYSGIGTELRRRDLDPLAGRAFVPMERKAGLTIAALFREGIRNRPFKDPVSHALT